MNLKELVSALRPLETEQRILDRDVIAVAGVIGHIAGDLSVSLALSRLTAPGRTAAVDLLDSGCFSADERGALSITRLPANAVERRMLREALGLVHNRSDT
jgi:hypothetical protein